MIFKLFEIEIRSQIVMNEIRSQIDIHDGTLHSHSTDPSIINDSDYVSPDRAFPWLPGNANMTGKLPGVPSVTRCCQM